MKKQYQVVQCKRCGVFMLALSNKKTRTCPRCGYRLDLPKTKKWFETENPEIARAYVEARNKLGPGANEEEVIEKIEEILRGKQP